MIIYPAIDLYDGKAVRLFRGDYNQMTVYHDNPVCVAMDFVSQGADHIHLVDLEGAKTGLTPNLSKVVEIRNATGAFCEIGGGIRSMSVLDAYFSAGIDRAILGTSAVTDEAFLKQALSEYGSKIAVGIDLKDGYVAIKGWTETSDRKAEVFCAYLQELGVKTLICTDISKDGAMEGTNQELYRMLSESYEMDIIASGGVSSIDDVKKLAQMQLHGAIIGKAYYTGAISLREAIEVSR